MKRNIDELLKEKYKEIEYNNTELGFKNIRKNNNLYKVASIILLIIAVTITVKIYNSGQKLVADNNVNENTIPDDKQELDEVVADYQIVVGAMDNVSYGSYYTTGLEDMEVLAIRVNKILGYTNYSEKQDKYSLPVTKFEAQVLKCFNGNTEGNIEIYTLGGIVSLANWEKTLNNEQKEKMGYNKMTQEYKENTYVEIVTSLNLDRDKPEVGKTYLVCLNYDSHMYDGFITAGAYAIREYDMSTNSIKSNGKWKQVKDIVALSEIIK